MATTADYLTQLTNDLANSKISLQEKGVTLTGNETFTDIPTKIMEIQSGTIIYPRMIKFMEYTGNIINGLKYINTKNIQDMSNMFSNCLDIVELDLSSFDTTKVSSMSEMFLNCNKLEKLNLSSFDIRVLNNIYRMFYKCRSLTSLDLRNFDISRLNYMNEVFFGCENLVTLDLSNLDTSLILNMYNIFSGCSKLENLRIKGIKCNLSVSSCPLSLESVAYILQHLGTVTTSKTLTLGTTNLAKATEEDLASATEKGWTVN